MSKWRDSYWGLLALLVLVAVSWILGTPTHLDPRLELALVETTQLADNIEALEAEVQAAKGGLLQSAATESDSSQLPGLQQAKTDLLKARFELENARCAHRWDQHAWLDEYLTRARSSYQASRQNYLLALAAWQRKRGAELDFKLHRQVV